MELESENYAHGGSTTDNSFVSGMVTVPPGPKTSVMVPSLNDQVSIFLAMKPNGLVEKREDTLYPVWSGHNDFFNGVYQPAIGSEQFLAIENFYYTAKFFGNAEQ